MEKSNWRVDKLHNFLLQFWQACKVSNQIFRHSGNKLVKNNSTKHYFQSKRRSIQDHDGMLCELICLLLTSCEHDMTQLVSMIQKSSHDNHGPSTKIDFVKERILLLLFSQHQGLNRSIRLPRCNALWPQHEQS